MRYLSLIFFIFAQLLFPITLKSEQFDFIFSKSNKRWVGDFTDFPVGQETFLELAWGWQNLPTIIIKDPDPSLTKGMFLSGNNHSDDLFMFIKRQIVGLEPDTLYSLNFTVTIVDNIPVGQAGTGGSPGEDVFFKVGASKKEPRRVAIDGFYVLNVDKGNQSTGGKNAVVVGNLANPLVNPSDPQYFPLTYFQETPLQVKTDREGRLWIFVGTDSGFEGSTNYFIAQISLTADPVDPSSEHHHCKLHHHIKWLCPKKHRRAELKIVRAE